MHNLFSIIFVTYLNIMFSYETRYAFITKKNKIERKKMLIYIGILKYFDCKLFNFVILKALTKTDPHI